MMKNLFLLIIPAVFMACHKKSLSEPETETPIVNQPMQKGFTSHPKEINGYMYACCRSFTSSSGAYTNFTVYATFSDPPRNIMKSFNHYTDESVFFGGNSDMGNISVGLITFDGIQLNPTTFNPNIFYRNNNNTSVYNFNYTANWEADGNRTFKEFNTAVPGGFPLIQASNTPTSISRSSNFVVNFPLFLTNYDSAAVIISSNSFGNQIVKNIGKPATSVTFSSTELTNLLYNTFGCNITYIGFNYSNQVIENISYVYELSNKHSDYVVVTP